MVGVVVERPTATLRFAGSIPAPNKYLCDLQLVPGLAVSVCDLSVFVHAPTIQEFIIRSEGQFFYFIRETNMKPS